jgi:DNA (cytosine-5)-methyltransferase 1
MWQRPTLLSVPPVTAARAPKVKRVKPTFIDLFAGCGGLSLGLIQGGWRGLFAVEKDANAFSTLKANLIDGNRRSKFEWPRWLEKKPSELQAVIRMHSGALRGLRGNVDLIVGGPPCQGFSSAGRRDPDDPRNRLFKQYLRVIGLVQPDMLLLENVRGISLHFATSRKRPGGKGRLLDEPFSERIRRSLERHGYATFPMLLRSVDYGVPQTRPRYFMVGVRRKSSPGKRRVINPFAGIAAAQRQFLKSLGLRPERPVTVKDAISDLRKRGSKLIECIDSSGFKQIAYRGPVTPYQVQMHGSMNGHAPNSLRLPNHSPKIVTRFTKMVRKARKGVSLSAKERRTFGVKKHSIVVLDGAAPSHTLTTLPDDYIHYSEGRILTVREYARLQSFPDWFEFRGVYTTGGERRKKSCPRYTQVGNAVPPRLASFLGVLIRKYARDTGLKNP